jgi:hypothetical protein
MAAGARQTPRPPCTNAAERTVTAKGNTVGTKVPDVLASAATSSVAPSAVAAKCASASSVSAASPGRRARAAEAAARTERHADRCELRARRAREHGLADHGQLHGGAGEAVNASD